MMTIVVKSMNFSPVGALTATAAQDEQSISHDRHSTARYGQVSSPALTWISAEALDAGFLLGSDRCWFLRVKTFLTVLPVDPQCGGSRPLAAARETHRLVFRRGTPFDRTSAKRRTAL